MPTAAAVIKELRDRGCEVTYDWPATGEDHANEWTEDKRRAVAAAEIVGASLATDLILILPGGRGAHVELGAALSCNATAWLIVCGPEPVDSLFYHHPRVKFVRNSIAASSIIDEVLKP